MKAELAAKLAAAMRGGNPPKTGVADVAGVAGVAATGPKPLKLQQLRPLRVKNTTVDNGAIRDVVGGVATITEREPAPSPAAHDQSLRSVEMEHPFPISPTYGAHWGENLPPDEAEALAKARREVAQNPEGET